MRGVGVALAVGVGLAIMSTVRVGEGVCVLVGIEPFCE